MLCVCFACFACARLCFFACFACARLCFARVLRVFCACFAWCACVSRSLHVYARVLDVRTCFCMCFACDLRVSLVFRVSFRLCFVCFACFACVRNFTRVFCMFAPAFLCVRVCVLHACARVFCMCGCVLMPPQDRESRVAQYNR